MNGYKWIILCGVLCFTPQALCAQDIGKEMKEFDEFVKAQQKEFSDFVSEQNRQFIQFLKENWKSYESDQTEDRPKRPEPVAPVKIDKQAPIYKPKQIPVGKIQRIPEVSPSATFPDLTGQGGALPDADSGELGFPKGGLGFDFFGISCSVELSMKNCVSLSGISEHEIASGWEKISRQDFHSLVNACLEAKARYQMNDYAYFLYVEEVAKNLLVRDNEIVLMQAFILCQCGYKVKMARVDGKLALLYASEDMIYGTTYLTMNGERYYKWGAKVENGTSIYTYTKNFADSKYMFSTKIVGIPAFYGATKGRILQSKKYPSLKITSQVYEGLIAFYKSYPQCDLSVYFNAPVSRTVETSVVEALRRCVKGKPQVEAANMLIDFVQTAFAYQTDGEQFGYEKPFFVEELFYYPYCDCEDRAFLYAYLVREILNLDVVLLDYPNHVATAVCFTGAVEGDYVMVNGKKFVICDPTYIGASIGMTMPQFKSVAAKVLMR